MITQKKKKPLFQMLSLSLFFLFLFSPFLKIMYYLLKDMMLRSLKDFLKRYKKGEGKIPVLYFSFKI